MALERNSIYTWKRDYNLIFKEFTKYFNDDDYQIVSNANELDLNRDSISLLFNNSCKIDFIPDYFNHSGLKINVDDGNECFSYELLFNMGLSLGGISIVHTDNVVKFPVLISVILQSSSGAKVMTDKEFGKKFPFNECCSENFMPIIDEAFNKAIEYVGTHDKNVKNLEGIFSSMRNFVIEYIDKVLTVRDADLEYYIWRHRNAIESYNEELEALEKELEEEKSKKLIHKLDMNN